MSVGKRVLSKTAHSIFLKLLIKLGCLKFKNMTDPRVWEKSNFGHNFQKHTQNRVFWILQKRKTVHCCIDFMGLNYAP